MILQLLTKLLQKETVDGQNMKQIMNQNAAGQLIIDIISLGSPRNNSSGGGSSGSSSRIPTSTNNSSRISGPSWRSSSLLAGALHCGIELLRGGHNTSCQRILYRYLQTPPHAQQFFGSIQQLLVRPFSTSPATSAQTEPRGKQSSLDRSSPQPPTLLRGDLQQLSALLNFLQLLCEGHYLDMQNLIFARVSFMRDCVQLFQDLVRSSLGHVEHFLLINALVLMRVLDFFTEVVQGPCLKNQELLLKNEGFITTLDQLASYYLPVASIVWDAVPQQCLRFEILQNTLNAMETVGQTKFARVLNFAELKGIKNRILLLQISLLEGRQLTSTDVAKFMTMTLQKRCFSVLLCCGALVQRCCETS